jgi:predicted nucleic acid-binding Zn ribbon protein
MTNNPAVLKCPKCGGVGVRMISAGGGLLFKGPGFYATDYRKPANKPTKE